MRLVLALGLLLVSTIAYAGTRVQVEGHGNTEKEAQQDACITAVKQVVGQVIVSDQEVNNDRLTKNFIGSYSAGYCDDSEQLEKRQDDHEIVVKMNVSVASSKIAQRMLSSGNKDLIIEGERLQTQIDSQLDQRNKGDQLIAEVSSSYPYNAYVINSGQTDIAIGPRRDVYLEIPYEIRWSRFWLEALNETLGVIAIDSKSCSNFWAKQDNRIRLSSGSGLLGRLRDTPCGQEADLRLSHNGSTNSYYFYDRKTLEMINAQLQSTTGQQHIGVKVNLKDAGGTVMDTRCAKIPINRFIGYTEPRFEVVHWSDQGRNMRPVIDGDARVYGTFVVHLHTKEQISEIARVTLTVEKTCT